MEQTAVPGSLLTVCWSNFFCYYYHLYYHYNLYTHFDYYWYLLGIASFGTCGENTPGLFTRFDIYVSQIFLENHRSANGCHAKPNQIFFCCKSFVWFCVLLIADLCFGDFGEANKPSPSEMWFFSIYIFFFPERRASYHGSKRISETETLYILDLQNCIK